MVPLPDKLQMIVASGGGIIIDAKTQLPDKLQMIAATAKSSGAIVILKNAGVLLPDKAQMIGAAGGGRVILDYT